MNAPRAFTRSEDCDEDGTRYVLLAEDEHGTIELDRSSMEGEWEGEVAWLNGHLDELRSEIKDARNLTGNYAPRVQR
jgi:hypothetical protein